MKTTISTFSLANLTDPDLARLLEDCLREQNQRQRRQTERMKWIGGMYYAYLEHPNATSIQVDDVTVVSVFNRNTGMRMATARPVHGDTFDHDTGIAVAYAKAIGKTVPDFI